MKTKEDLEEKLRIEQTQPGRGQTIGAMPNENFDQAAGGAAGGHEKPAKAAGGAAVDDPRGALVGARGVLPLVHLAVDLAELKAERVVARAAVPA